MKKLILLSLILIFQYISSYGQAAHELEVNEDLPTNPIFDPQKVCNSVEIMNTTTVLYETGAEVKIVLKKLEYNFSPIVLEIIGKDQKPEVLDFKTGESMVLSNIPLNYEYTIKTYNSCGQEMLLGGFSTIPKKDEVIGLNDDLYSKVVEWTKVKNEQKIRFYEFLIEDKSLDLLEKSYFIQKFYFDGEVFPNDYKGTLPSIKDRKFGNKCKCNFVMNTTQIAEPVKHFFYPNTNDRIGFFDYVRENTSESTGYKDWYQYQAAVEGPSRWLQLDMRGKRSHYNVIRQTGHNEDGIDRSPHSASLRYTFLCENIAGGLDKEECLCEKTINIDYSHNTKVQVSTALPTCSLCGSKGAYASAEDHAILVQRNATTGVAQVLDKQHIFIESECNKTWNKEAFLNIIDLASNIGKYFVTKDKDKDSTGIKLTVLIDSVSAGLKRIVVTPFYFQKSCDNIEKSVSLLNGRRDIKFKSNQALDLIMFSQNQLRGDGTTSYKITSKLVSDFHLASVMVPQVMDKDTNNIFCCNTKFANFVFASTLGAPHDYQVVKYKTKSYINLYGPWAGINSLFDLGGNSTETGPLNFGYLNNGIKPDNCLSVIDINTRSTKKPIINDQNTADIQYHNGILKIDNKNNLNLKYQIISVDGKVLSSGASLFGSDITLNLDIPMGIFFVKVFDDNKTVSKSFIKN